MHNIDMRIRQPCYRGQSVYRFGFYIVGSRQSMIFSLSPARSQKPLCQYVCQSSVLAMHPRNAAYLFHFAQHFKNLSVREAKIRISHIQLKGRNAFLRHICNFLERLRVSSADSHMKAIVAVRALRLFLPYGKSVSESHIALLSRKVQNCGRPSEKSRPRARIEIVSRSNVAERHIKVSMSIYKPRKHKHSVCIYSYCFCRYT